MYSNVAGFYRAYASSYYVRRFDVESINYDLGRALAHDRLWFRRFIPRDAFMPAPAECCPLPIAYESRHVRQERANHAQRRAALRRRFVQELAK